MKFVRDLMREEIHTQQTGSSRFLLHNGDSELSLHLEAIGSIFVQPPPPPSLADKNPSKIPRIAKGARRRSTSRKSSRSG